MPKIEHMKLFRFRFAGGLVAERAARERFLDVVEGLFGEITRTAVARWMKFNDPKLAIISYGPLDAFLNITLEYRNETDEPETVTWGAEKLRSMDRYVLD